MKYAFVKNGVAIEVVESDPALLFVPGYAAHFVAVPDSVLPNWQLTNGTWTAPPPQSAAIPQSVTMRQARLALLNHSLLANVQPAINALPEPQRTRAQIEWDYSNGLERGNSFVATLGVALGLDDAAIDSLFIEAAAL